MTSLMEFSFRKVLVVYLVTFLFTSILLSVPTSETHDELPNSRFLGRRRMLEMQEEEEPKKKSTSSSLPKKNQTKLIKPSLSTKNQTQLIKSSLSSKNQTKKLLKPTNSTKATLSNLSKSELKKLNSTTKTLKATNSSTKLTSLSTSKSSDPLKLSTPKNKTTKSTSTKQTETQVDKKLSDLDSFKPKKSQNKETAKPKQEKTLKKHTQPSWVDQEHDDDLVSEFRDLPTKFQQTLIPDLERISTTSKAYLNKYNKEITRGFKPIVGHKYAPTIASIVSFAFILIPLILVSLIFNRIKAYFSLHKILIFIQVYLSIYFSILCLSALVTGLEPLKFFYATSQSTYVCVQVFQSLCYVLYLLLLLMYLILVFSTDCGLSSRMLGLGQTFVGYAVGLHYYVAVFHRVVLHQPPKTNWKIHGIYATCFLVICLFARAERRKKAYQEEGGEEGKKS